MLLNVPRRRRKIVVKASSSKTCSTPLLVKHPIKQRAFFQKAPDDDIAGAAGAVFEFKVDCDLMGISRSWRVAYRLYP